ncbi:hypothetical protein FRB99_005637 [Tulasnella sp. 403]|nr:hypothetical protein FRB99_005637 [Tulasnella sp. 403]
MSGLTLPRDAGTCTRCPMECRLQSGPTWSCSVRLRFEFDIRGRPLGSAKVVPFGRRITDRDLVEGVIRQAQRAILSNAQDVDAFLEQADDVDLPNGPQSFSKNCVCVDVQGPGVPDLCFYDLPGIIANVSEGGDERDIQLVEDLVKSYIKRPNCIVLLVVSCETDYENQGAARLIKKDRGILHRTVGVLTKVDRIEPGGEGRWLSMLRNESERLENGWFCVKQRKPADLSAGVPLEEARSQERKFFNETPPWDALDQPYRDRIGSVALSEHLGSMLARLIEAKLPEVYAAITERLDAVLNELNKLPVPVHDNPKHAVILLLRRFSRLVSEHVKGKPPSPKAKVDKSKFEAGLRHCVNKEYAKFRHYIHQTAPQFLPCTSDRLGSVTSDMQREATKFDAPDGRCGPVFFIDEIKDLAERSRTKELPGNYPFSVKSDLIKESTEGWKTLAMDCFEKVEGLLRDHVEELVARHFRLYMHGDLPNIVSGIVRKQIYLLANHTRTLVHSLCESEDTPYTQNEDFFFKTRNDLGATYKSVYQRSLSRPPERTVMMESPHSHMPRAPRPDPYNEAITALAKLGIHGINPHDLAQLIHVQDMQTALDIMAEVRAYFQVAYKRFGDNVPKQIDVDFLDGFERGLDVALFEKFSMGIMDEQCSEWLQEPPELMRRRQELGDMKEALENAVDALRPVVRNITAADVSSDRSSCPSPTLHQQSVSENSETSSERAPSPVYPSAVPDVHEEIGCRVIVGGGYLYRA